MPNMIRKITVSLYETDSRDKIPEIVNTIIDKLNELIAQTNKNSCLLDELKNLTHYEE